MTSQRIHALILEIDVGGSVECLLKGVCTHKRGAAIELILLSHFLWDIYPGVLHVEFLLCTLGSEHMTKVFGSQGFVGCRIKRWQWFVDHVGLYVIPLLWNLVFVQNEFLLS